MNEQDFKFCQDHIVNFEAIELGFCRHINYDILDEYQRIYHRTISPEFRLNSNCSRCVFRMLQELSKKFKETIETRKTKAYAKPKNSRSRK
jgi:hypothetical protein